MARIWKANSNSYLIDERLLGRMIGDEGKHIDALKPCSNGQLPMLLAGRAALCEWRLK